MGLSILRQNFPTCQERRAYQTKGMAQCKIFNVFVSQRQTKMKTMDYMGIVCIEQTIIAYKNVIHFWQQTLTLGWVARVNSKTALLKVLNIKCWHQKLLHIAHSIAQKILRCKYIADIDLYHSAPIWPNIGINSISPVQKFTDI